jgi:hypothetical protein
MVRGLQGIAEIAAEHRSGQFRRIALGQEKLPALVTGDVDFERQPGPAG